MPVIWCSRDSRANDAVSFSASIVFLKKQNEHSCFLSSTQIFYPQIRENSSIATHPSWTTHILNLTYSIKLSYPSFVGNVHLSDFSPAKSNLSCVTIEKGNTNPKHIFLPDSRLLILSRTYRQQRNCLKTIQAKELSMNFQNSKLWFGFS